MFATFFKKNKWRNQAHILYQQLVTQARRPAFYLEPYSIADTIEGRFDLILLHLFIVEHSLSDDENNIAIRRHLQEAMVDDMDRSLREMGVGDMSVGKEMKKVGAALLGRMQSYSDAVSSSEAEKNLTTVISRNMTCSDSCAQLLSNYVLKSIDAIRKSNITENLGEELPFSCPTDLA